MEKFRMGGRKYFNYNAKKNRTLKQRQNHVKRPQRYTFCTIRFFPFRRADTVKC